MPFAQILILSKQTTDVSDVPQRLLCACIALLLQAVVLAQCLKATAAIRMALCHSCTSLCSICANISWSSALVTAAGRILGRDLCAAGLGGWIQHEMAA